VLLVYLIGITIMGVWTGRKVHSLADYFMPRRFGKAFMMMHSFGTGTHSDQAVQTASKTFTNGLSGIWYTWLTCSPRRSTG
jgi:Na+/proline symporter